MPCQPCKAATLSFPSSSYAKKARRKGKMPKKKNIKSKKSKKYRKAIVKKSKKGITLYFIKNKGKAGKNGIKTKQVVEMKLRAPGKKGGKRKVIKTFKGKGVYYYRPKTGKVYKVKKKKRKAVKRKGVVKKRKSVKRKPKRGKKKGRKGKKKRGKK
jgi:hypothetical protein